MIKNLARGGILLVLCLLAVPVVAHAQLTSPNYSIEEVMIGTGGDPELCSGDFCAMQSSGSTAVGEASSNGYGLQAGFGTPDEPTLVVAVTNNIIDLGVLNTSTTAAASFNFSVSNYLSDGYVVRIHGQPPTNPGSSPHQLDPMDGASGSQQGTEQFGINLVANTDPGIGANPVQVPDGTFSDGQPAVGYDQVDIYKYEDGGIIAESDRESGQTNYTVSVIANVGTATPGGRYSTTLVVQVVATF